MILDRLQLYKKLLTHLSLVKLYRLEILMELVRTYSIIHKNIATFYLKPMIVIIIKFMALKVSREVRREYLHMLKKMP